MAFVLSRLKQEEMSAFALDYADTGIKYQWRMPNDGRTDERPRVLVSEKMPVIPRIRVESLAGNGLCGDEPWQAIESGRAVIGIRAREIGQHH